MMRRILFVCTGNTCRSPMAEGLFRLMAAREGLDLEIRSAGVSAFDGGAISEHTAAILREQGIADPGQSRSLDKSIVDWADLILTMTASHKQVVIQRNPHAFDKVHTLKEYVEDDPGILEQVQVRQSFVAELQMKRALSQPFTDEDQRKASELDRDLPDFDVRDPFGGPLEVYREVANELQQALGKLQKKLKREM